MSEHGRLAQWNDERGFGFIEAGDGRKLFVHISAIGRIATRPRIGDPVSFVSSRGADGRWQARSVHILGANPASARAVRHRGLTEPPAVLDWRCAAALLVFGLVGCGMLLDRVPVALAMAYMTMGLVSFLAYHADKRFAENGHWRISEVTLLSLDLGFGVAGGLIGQTVFRHKTRKPSYVATTVLILFAHLLWLGGLAVGLIDLESLARDIAGLPATGG